MVTSRRHKTLFSQIRKLQKTPAVLGEIQVNRNVQTTTHICQMQLSVFEENSIDRRLNEAP